MITIRIAGQCCKTVNNTTDTELSKSLDLLYTTMYQHNFAIRSHDIYLFCSHKHKNQCSMFLNTSNDVSLAKQLTVECGKELGFSS